MPIKLNPCAKCGGKPSTLYEAIKNRYFSASAYTVACVKCNQSVVAQCKKETSERWNAANPKEEAK